MLVVHAQDPARAAGAIAALVGGRSSPRPGGRWSIARIAAVVPRAAAARPGITRLLLAIDLGPEQVIEIACAHGFHAEELRRSGVIEFWIDEHAVVELVTTAAAHNALAA